MVHSLAAGGLAEFESVLTALQAPASAGVARPAPASIQLLLAAVALCAGDATGARDRLIEFGTDVVAVEGAFLKAAKESWLAWPQGRQLAPVGWLTGDGTSGRKDGTPKGATSVWLKLRTAHPEWRPADFEEWLESEAKDGPTPRSRASAALAAALVLYADLALGSSAADRRRWAADPADMPQDAGAHVRELLTEFRTLREQGCIHGHWNDAQGRWFLKRFLVDRDWGDDAAAVADLVEKGRTLLRAPESK
ncbi:MAG: hypothetical protein HMLKMBBP_01463 [Planctomycetes bacterium]|nr:hypothetical protein [Planctomycetota bacterium]